MNEKIEKYKSMGVEISSAMERFLDDEELFLDCAEKMLDDENFEKLENALNNNDIQTAFDAAHTLKGVFANMSFTPLFNEVVEIVEPLRAGKTDGCMEHYKKLCEIRDEYKKV